MGTFLCVGNFQGKLLIDLTSVSIPLRMIYSQAFVIKFHCLVEMGSDLPNDAAEPCSQDSRV